MVCGTSKSGVLTPGQMKRVGLGMVSIPANLARLIPTMFANLRKKHALAAAEDVAVQVQTQLCTWCDGMGWQLCNMGENAAGCFNCNASGVQPMLKRRMLLFVKPPETWDSTYKGCPCSNPFTSNACQVKRGNHKIHKYLDRFKNRLECWTL